MRSLIIYLSLIFLSFVSWASAADQSGGGHRAWRDPFSIENQSTAHQGDSLSLPTVLAKVAAGNPLMRSFAVRGRRASALINQAGRGPNPTLSLDAENMGGSYSAFSQSEIALGLTQRLEFGGKRGARKTAAIADSLSIELENSITRFELYALTRERFYATLHAQEQLALAEHAKTIADGVVDAVALRVQEGASPISDRQLAEIERQRAILAVGRLQTELAARQQHLTALWSGDESRLAVTGLLAVSTSGEMTISIDSLTKFAAEVQSADASLRTNSTLVRSERSSGHPDLDVTGGVKRLEADKATTFMLGLSFPLPLFDRRQGSVAALLSRSEEITLAKTKAEIQARTELQILQMQLAQEIASRNAVQAEILPSSERAFAGLQEAYRLGTIPYSNLLEGERAVIEARSLLNDLNLEIRQTLIGFERLVGRNSEVIFSIEERQ